MRKKLLAGLLCLCMVATFLPGTAGAVDTEEPTTPAAGHDTQQAADVASVKSGETTTYYETIEAAWTAATDEGVTEATVTLLKNAQVTTTLSVPSGKVITFAGTGDATLISSAKEIVSVAGGTFNLTSGIIKLECNPTDGTFHGITVWNNGCVNMSGGSIILNFLNFNNQTNYRCQGIGLGVFAGTVNITGGTIESAQGGSSAISMYARLNTDMELTRSVTISGNARITGSLHGIDAIYGNLTVNGGTIKAGNDVVPPENMLGWPAAIEAGDHSMIVITDGTIEAHCGVRMWDNSTVNMNGGTINAVKTGIWAYATGSKVAISGGTINSGSDGLYISDGTAKISGGTYEGAESAIYMSSSSAQANLEDLLKADDSKNYAYFRNDVQVPVSELAGRTLSGTITVKAVKRETVLTITASVATEAVPEIPVAIAEGDEAPGDTPTATKKVVTLTVNGPSEVLDRVTVTCDAELTLTKVANATSKWTCDLPEGAEANKPYTFTASFAGDETWAAASTKCIVLGDGTVKDCSNGHTWDEGVQTKAPTATEPGEKTFTCTVCGATKKEVIPATGGTTPDPTPSTPSGGGSYTPPSNTTTETTKNPDGSTTTKTENKTTGTVTETTKNPDGSTTKVETKKDGTVTTTQTDATGDKTETVERPDGSSVTKVDQKNGTKATVNTDTEGKVEAEVTLPKQVVAAAQEGSSAIMLPVPRVEAAASSEAAPVVTVKTGSDEPVKVLIPTTEGKPGTVAVIVNEDGSEEIVKTSVSTEDGLAVSLPDGATVKIVDNSKSFNDVPASNWAADAVSFSAARELFSGTSESTFSPDEPMTRAMMVTVLARFDGADTSGGSTWYEQGVEWAVSKGISDGSNPDSNISREQLAVMLWRYAGSPAPTGNLDQFDDAGSVSGYAQDAMRWAVENGIVNGNGAGSLLPQGNATRAQVAQMLKNFISMQ